jgi:hypothetical protein
MAFNPASLDTRAKSDEGVWLTLTDLNGEEIFDGGKPVQLHIMGKDSAVVKEMLNEMDLKAHEVNDGNAEIAAKFVKGWSDNIEAKTALELVEVPVIREFVIRAVVDRANFTNKKPKS